MLGGIFSMHENPGDAFEVERNSDGMQKDIHIIFPVDDTQAREAFVDALIRRIRTGNILVKSQDRSNPVPSIEMIDANEPGFFSKLNQDLHA